jgi:hypothetical protein
VLLYANRINYLSIETLVLVQTIHFIRAAAVAPTDGTLLGYGELRLTASECEAWQEEYHRVGDLEEEFMGVK